MQAMSLNFALAQNTSFTVDMRVIFHINNILNDFMQVYEKSYNACT